MTSKKLNLWTAISIVMGCVIGSGVFVKPGRVLAATASANEALLAWVLGGLITLAGGLTLAEIAFRIPKTGGIYVYLEELYGKRVGFLCGWVQSLIYGPALMSAIALYFGSLFCHFFHIDASNQKAIALLTMFALSTVIAVSTQASAWIQNITTVVKLLPIGLIALFGIFKGGEPLFGTVLADTSHATGMGVAILATLWAYDGWIQVANMAGEIENPAKNLPKAISIGIVGIIVVYVAVNFSLFHTLSIAKVVELNEKSANVASEIFFGPIGGTIVSFGILIAIFGCLNGNILTGTRVPYAMASRKAFPFQKFYGTLHPKFGTPVNSIVLMSIVATLMILLLNPDRITDIAIFSMYVFYCIVYMGLFKVRKEYGKPKAKEYKVPFFPVVPILAILGGVFICYSMIKGAPMDAAISVGIALAGLPVHAALERKAKR